MSTLQEDIEREFPPASVNNSREIVRSAVSAYQKSGSFSSAKRVERLTTWELDHEEGHHSGVRMVGDPKEDKSYAERMHERTGKLEEGEIY